MTCDMLHLRDTKFSRFSYAMRMPAKELGSLAQLCEETQMGKLCLVWQVAVLLCEHSRAVRDQGEPGLLRVRTTSCFRKRYRAHLEWSCCMALMIGPLEISRCFLRLNCRNRTSQYLPNNAIKPRDASAASVSRRKADAGLACRQAQEAEGKSWHQNIPFRLAVGVQASILHNLS